MLKILQARLQQYMNCEFPEVQAGFTKDRGTRVQIASIHWIIEKAIEFQKKKIGFFFIDYAKAFNCVEHNKLENSERGRNSRPLHPPFEKSVCRSGSNRTEHGTTDWFQTENRVHQGCLLSPCLFNLYAECIMRYAGLEEAQAGIKISGRNANNLRYVDDTTLMEESEELKNFLMKMKEESGKKLS